MEKTWLLAALVAASPACAQQQQPVIDVNQLGFEPSDVKLAVLRGAGAEPMKWQLLDANGNAVGTGETMVYGPDASSGAVVQRIDFSGFRRAGSGYRLSVAGVTSDRFTIAENVYRPLVRDAANFFYQQRAGLPIDARFAGAAWARPAGHASEVAACFSGADERGTRWPGCNYRLDVTGGWYDAGDHGKYVVNGGIALWTLLNAYERRPAAFPDGALRIPESGNGVSDLLDEARWEMEFLLRMQIADGVRASVPTGPLGRSQLPPFVEIDAGGMAHQKVADRTWTKLPMPPQNDPEERLLYPPTTGATLNLAATAAQCARLWRGIDDAFAARCLAAARRAWAAAQRNPQVFATSSFTGSGGYGDSSLSDEFYWAAAELYATTGEAPFHQAVAASPHFGETVRAPGWNATAPLGTITLATVKTGLTAAELQRVRQAVIAGADRILAQRRENGYALAYRAVGYPWGSNGDLLNHAMLLGVAGDLTGDGKYRPGLVSAMDYVLGRNPLGQSYVSGYGTRPLRNPHHRFWAHVLDSKLPGPPPGVLSGGPNDTAMSDPVAAKLKGKCAPQTCWADEIGAYALNEVAINWNAPLFWVAAWLED
ncbi:glycoside hydrolase family 9 protein [Sphingomonas sp. HT-1]|uniref:glycoside hydrolase family 9 protein n=1 Tax=unclassified Sphingomonas TaxID=196159 RepID=UPI00037846A6|nr:MULTISPECIES: glycoside hydrolase family 9 protein [unclassified Sphingomonas]KTF67385.1 glycosyl hydrolase [Sphingomonas sp. WG]